MIRNDDELKVEFLENGQMIISHHAKRRRWWLFGPIIEKVTRYHGQGTVWRELPSGRRPGTLVERRFADVAAKATWEHSVSTSLAQISRRFADVAVGAKPDKREEPGAANEALRSALEGAEFLRAEFGASIRPEDS